MKLLLIEDEDFIRDLYKRQLELAGIPTDAFGMGNDGLNAAHQNPTAYDLVLLDIMLPDTNGLQILKDLKQNTPTKSIPVILLTNLSQDMLIKEGFELGAEGYLVKAAYTPAQIVQEVKNILAKKPSTATTQVPNVVPQVGPVSPQAAPTIPAATVTTTTTTETTPPMATPIVTAQAAPPMPQGPANLPVGTPPPMSDPLGNTSSMPSPTSTPAPEAAATTIETTTTTTETTSTDPTAQTGA